MSTKENALTPAPGAVYRNLKLGTEYRVQGFAKNTTNKDDGAVMVLYTEKKGKFVFVREIKEFIKKFEAVEDLKGGALISWVYGIKPLETTCPHGKDIHKDKVPAVASVACLECEFHKGILESKQQVYCTAGLVTDESSP